jgi:hypothetical protein
MRDSGRSDGVLVPSLTGHSGTLAPGAAGCKDCPVPFTRRNLKGDLEDIGSVFDGPPDLEFRAATKPLELEAELTIAAAEPQRRASRLEKLLRERTRRRLRPVAPGLPLHSRVVSGIPPGHAVSQVTLSRS